MLDTILTIGACFVGLAYLGLLAVVTIQLFRHRP